MPCWNTSGSLRGSQKLIKLFQKCFKMFESLKGVSYGFGDVEGASGKFRSIFRGVSNVLRGFRDFREK